MENDLIRKVALLMDDQTDAYVRLESVTSQLSTVLMRGEANLVESFSKSGEKELQRMRARLLEITTSLSEFAEFRINQSEKTPLDADARSQFEKAAKELLDAAKRFQAISGQAGSLALGGSSFAAACIQVCGIPPSTYQKPVLNYGGGME